MVFRMENTLAIGEWGKGSGDGCWLLEGKEGKNGIEGGGERFLEANREGATEQ